MQKHVLGTFIAIFAFIAGFSINNIAMSVTQPEYKIAIIDVAKLLADSNEVKELKFQQEQKIKNIESTIKKAKIEISKETNPQKIATLEEKYRNEINKQKLAMDTEYNNKLIEIDQNIKNSVITKAKELNYNIVLPKNTVLFGGDDITAQVAPAVK